MPAARRRPATAPGGWRSGLAAVLVVALVATVPGACAAQRTTRERASLVADANRLAALSTTVGSLDLSLLLAAQGFRLADTPETQDGLLAALVEHRRAARAVAFTRRPVRRRPRRTTDGRSSSGRVSQHPALGLFSGEPAPDPHGPSGIGRLGGLERRKRRLAHGRADGLHRLGRGRHPWLRLADGDGPLRDGAERRTARRRPVRGAFTPDGRLAERARRLPAEGLDGAVAWRLVQIDPSGDVPRDTGVARHSPDSEDGSERGHRRGRIDRLVIWSVQDDRRRRPSSTSQPGARRRWRRRRGTCR